MKKEIKNKSHSKLDLESLLIHNDETLNQVQGDDKEIKINNKVIPEICSRESHPYVKAKRLISPTETLGDDGWCDSWDDGVCMANVPNNNTRGQRHIKAFTLIELLVVVLIIGILSAVALPQYEAAVEKARAAEIWPIMKSANQAWDLQYLADPENVSNIKAQDIIELSGGTWAANGKDYCTKNFRYSFVSWHFSAERCTPNADCSGCTDMIYYLASHNIHSEDYGDNDCIYNDTEKGNKIGKKVCNSFTGLISPLDIDER